ncbi:hypothetical protein [Paractinoplanes atraurantiacus]|uniref:AAA ATPase domain-containing protein n=1 Tax=Paractinoplanes atraurantiacus TaxID=1036182 RepID=A0A285GM20_9ACTN|nr:hypothetical protein [Actinoplanes atraurantiacus]SNY23391.1 hypothetical protein SAMN05421748_10234 [Actinoplanes atraurantiacus]
MTADAGELFFDDVVSDYVDDPAYVRRIWLEEAVRERLERPDCRYVVLIGEPGAGKSGLMAGLAARHPGWGRYFIRRDSTTPLSGGDAVSALLRVGHQLATRRPELFDPDLLTVVVNQRVAAAGPGASVVGVRIEDLTVSPFHRTAIRVEQHVTDLGGRLVGLDVARATVDPRLLTWENLQFLALLDPAAALASMATGERIVVLVDAIDESLRFRSEVSVLDWLERSPQLPQNVRIVFSSRPHPRLATLQGVRPGQVETIDLNELAGAVRTDTHGFATGVLRAPAIADRVADPGSVAEHVADASEGNFAYLRAWQRGLDGAVAGGDDELADSLLSLDVLPAGLGALYAVFLHNARTEIERLGLLDVRDPRSAGDELVPAWEGAGQRLVAVLAVARAPLSSAQLTWLGSVRVWPSAVDDLIRLLRPLLDEVEHRWQFFHPSVAEFLTGEAEDEAPDLFVRGDEWHRRVVRVYRGAAVWAEVDWTVVDDYGLLHLADHLAELGPAGQVQIIELVTAGMRVESRRRFLTDLPFQRLVEAALSHQDPGRAPADTLADALFLALVRADLGAGGTHLAPAVFGLMARLGRIDEAQARIELLPPGEHRFAATRALVACTPTAERHRLGPYDGAELLVAAATEVPVIDDSLFTGLRNREAVEVAAVALAPYDLDRALTLAAGAEPQWDRHRVHDLVLEAAAGARPPDARAPLIERMTGGRAAAAAQLACQVSTQDRDRLLSIAEQDVENGRAKEPLPALAQLVASYGEFALDRAEQFAAELLAAASAPGTETRHLLTAAKIVAAGQPGLAGELLDRIAGADNAESWAKTGAVRLWAVLGRPDKASEMADQVLEYERGLGWFGPADSIAELAVALDPADPDRARALADEAEELIVTAAEKNTDPYESRITSTLGMTAQAVRTWDPPRALRLARLMDGSWISGGPWDSLDGRLSALACLGIDACDGDPALARALLEECMPEQESRLGRADGRLVHGGFFRPVEDGGVPSLVRATNFITYMSNCLNYWHAARDRVPFAEPADVARSMQMGPGSRGSIASWAGVLAAAVTPTAADDRDAAIALTGWLDDPAERLIALAALIAPLSEADDPRRSGAVAAAGRAAVTLPRYTAELDLTKIDQAPTLRYLDPAARARFEAALLLPEEMEATASALAMAADSWYLSATLRAQRLVDRLYGPVSAHPDALEVAAFVRDAVGTADQVPDPIQQDLIRMAGLWVVTPIDGDLAAEILSGIRDPGRQLLGRLFVAALTRDPAVLADAVRQELDDAPAGLAPTHRAMAVATALRWLGEDDRRELTDREVAALAEVDPWSAAVGLLMLAEGDAGLVRAALDRIAGIENVYLRVDLLADVLAVAAETGDMELIVAVACRQLDAGWQPLMEGLRRAVTPLAAVAGTDVFARLDTAFRAAQAIVGPAVEGHLDGVADPGARDPDPIPDPGPPPALEAFREVYLTAEDLPGMQLVQDSADLAPDPGDYAFSACGGVGTGLRVWLAPDTSSVWRLVDIRFVFPDAASAAAYHAERLLANSEGNPPIPEALPVGEECRVFGGARLMPIAEIEMTMFFYVFRVSSVVVKLFVARGVAATEPLEVAQAHAIAERAAARILRLQ